MNFNSTLFSRLRIRGEEAPAPDAPRCEHPGCQAAGEYRAPKGRTREGQYFRFCLPHVQEYNKSYNYFSGMNDDAVQAFQKDALTGHRPTWGIGVNAKAGQTRAGNATYTDPFDLFEQAGRGRARARAEAEQPKVGRIAQKALETLHLDETADAAAIRAKYKQWVKRLHPDANGGDRSNEDKLREIINAYNTLKASGLA
jgi:curved DNA-binding protein CbpA